VYVIDDYQLIESKTEVFLTNFSKAVKISSHALNKILNELKQQEKMQISEEALKNLAATHAVNLDVLKNILLHQLKILKPLMSRKFSTLYIDTDDALISELLGNTFNQHYICRIVEKPMVLEPYSLVIFYRNNYSNADFKEVHARLPNKVYLITAGLVHKLLIIDNLYFKNSGLPTHFSNFHQLITYFKSDIPATKNNWLLFYRELLKNNYESFPNTQVNDCQRGFIAYGLYQFTSQFTHFWGPAMTLDKINWFWQIDLTNFTVHQEVAVHSPFSEFDMKLNTKIKSEVV
jgi:McbB family protein